MKLIKLKNGGTCIVDDADFEYLSKFEWKRKKSGGGPEYIVRVRSFKNDQGRWIVENISMHRELMPCSDGMEVDHINGNPFDNRKSNLRVCTKAENGRNRGKNKNNTSGYKGVTWNKRDRKWIAQIMVDRKQIAVCRTYDIIEAIKAYNAAAIKYHGEFAKLNEIPA